MTKNNNILLFSCLNSSRPHGLQHTRLPCPSPSPGFCQVHVHWIGDAIQPSHPLSPSSTFSFFQHQGLFQWTVHIREPKYWSFSHSIRPSSDYSGLIFFTIDWFDLLAVQGTLKSLLHHHNLKALTLWHATFFMVQFSHLYMTTGKTIALTIWIFVDKMMSLLFNTLSRSVIAFLQRIQHILISWLQSLLLLQLAFY